MQERQGHLGGDVRMTLRVEREGESIRAQTQGRKYGLDRPSLERARGVADHEPGDEGEVDRVEHPIRIEADGDFRGEGGLDGLDRPAAARSSRDLGRRDDPARSLLLRGIADGDVSRGVERQAHPVKEANLGNPLARPLRPVLARVPDLAPRGVEVGDVGLSSGVDRERALDPYRPQGVGALQGEGNPARGRRLLGGFSARDRSKGKQEKGQSRGRDGTECARGHADSGKSQAQRWLGLYSREPA